MQNDQIINKCKSIADEMRVEAIQMAWSAGKNGAHLGGGLSLIEILAVLYNGILKIDADDPLNEDRDRFILSKGHGTLALYPALYHAGFIAKEDLLTYKSNHTLLSAHPAICTDIGIEFASGSLGQGLSLGVGTCLALNRKHNTTSNVYVVLGDGELDEGSVWEAAMSASHFGLQQLIAIVDCNKLQYDGPTKSVMNLDNLKRKWESFGWSCVCVDGHDISSLYDALSNKISGPYVILADTIKGKGISYMENNPLWHNGKMTQKQYDQALEELGVKL